MKEYREFQPGTLGLSFLVPTHLLIVYSYLAQIGADPIVYNDFILVNGIFLLVYLLFYGMKTRVNDNRILVSFGMGLIRRTIVFKSIDSVKTVKNPWYYGWGIRFISNGILYNVGGSAGIELVLKESGRVVRIGTRHADQLKEEVGKRLHGLKPLSS